MNSYEVLVIFKPVFEIENVDSMLNQFQKNIVEANRGEIAEIDRIGRKRLAYEIKKFKDGFMALFLIKLPAEKVSDFRRACQLSDDIIRMTMVSQDSIPSRELFMENLPPRRDDVQREEGFRRGRRDFGDRRDFRERQEFAGGRPQQDFSRRPREYNAPKVAAVPIEEPIIEQNPPED